MKKASIYKRGSCYYVTAECITEMGIGISCGECRRTADGNELYVLLLRAFEESRSDVPHPQDFKEFKRAYLSNFGVRSSAELHKGTILIIATERAGVITLVPYANLGAKEGFRGKLDMAIMLESNAEPQAVLEAIDNAFALATSLSQSGMPPKF